MKNFLRKSTSFINWAKASKSKNDLLSAFDVVAAFFSEGEIIDRKRVYQKLQENGFVLSLATVSKYCALYEIAYTYFKNDHPNKREEFLKKYSALEKNGYYKFINQGVVCLIRDEKKNNCHLGKIEKSIEKGDEHFLDKGTSQSVKKNTENIPQIKYETGDEFENANPDNTVLLDECKELDKTDEELQDALLVIESWYEKNRKRSEQLQFENFSLRKDLEAETDSRFELRRELDYAKKSISALEKEIQHLTGRNKGLSARLEKAKKENQSAEMMEKMDLLLRSINVKNKSASVKKKKLKEPPRKASEMLPLIYEPDMCEVEYEKSFTDDFNKISLANPKMKNRIIDLVKQICKLGVNGISKVKTISIASDHTPKNSLQKNIKKHRITFQKRNGKLTFYELFHRKNSPFAINRN